MRVLSLALLCVSLCSLLAGCAVGPVVEDGVGVEGTAANRSVWRPDGQVETTLQGMAPANVETSAAGANIQSSGQPRVLTFSITTPDGREIVATLNDPSDTEFSGFRMDPDGSIAIESFGAIASTGLAVQGETAIQSLITTGQITAEQAATIRAAWKAGGDLGRAIVEVLGPALVPVP